MTPRYRFVASGSQVIIYAVDDPTPLGHIELRCFVGTRAASDALGAEILPAAARIIGDRLALELTGAGELLKAIKEAKP